MKGAASLSFAFFSDAPFALFMCVTSKVLIEMHERVLHGMGDANHCSAMRPTGEPPLARMARLCERITLTTEVCSWSPWRSKIVTCPIACYARGDKYVGIIGAIASTLQVESE